MKIGIIGTRGIPARYGGFETCAEELAKGLAAREHRVYVACRRYLYPEFWLPKTRFFAPLRITPFCHPEQGEGSIFQFFPPSLPGKTTDTFSHTFFSVLYLLFFRPVDVVLVFNVANSPFVLLMRILGKRVALNTDGLEWKRKKWGPLARAYFRFCELLACLSSAVLISDSKAIAAYYRKKYGKRTVFIPYGAKAKDEIAAPLLQDRRDARLTEWAHNDILREYYGLETDGYFLVASRLEPENSADLIVTAFGRVKTDKLLVIAGGANWKSPFVLKLKQVKDPRVRYLGPCYKPGVIEQLHINCFAYIHGHQVGGTNPALLKAMGFGNCVLALNVPFNAEVIGEAGILFGKNSDDLAAKIDHLLANPEVVRYYRKAAPERIREFYQWEKVVEEYEKILG